MITEKRLSLNELITDIIDEKSSAILPFRKISRHH